jgi:phage N-6-adenine-methyltransferase
MARMPAQRPHRSKQDYRTPPAFVDAVCTLLGIERFTVDLAATKATRIRRADSCITPQMDALSRKWALDHGKWGDRWAWLNPPYARIAPWVEKAYEETRTHGNVAMLVPASVGANWWDEYVHERAAVFFLSPRLTFVGCTAPYPKDCALLLYKSPYLFDYPYYTTWRWQ